MVTLIFMCQHVLEKFKEIEVRNKNSTTLNLVWPLVPAAKNQQTSIEQSIQHDAPLKYTVKQHFYFSHGWEKVKSFKDTIKNGPFEARKGLSSFSFSRTLIILAVLSLEVCQCCYRC